MKVSVQAQCYSTAGPANRPGMRTIASEHCKHLGATRLGMSFSGKYHVGATLSALGASHHELFEALLQSEPICVCSCEQNTSSSSCRVAGPPGSLGLSTLKAPEKRPGLAFTVYTEQTVSVSVRNETGKRTDTVFGVWCLAH